MSNFVSNLVFNWSNFGGDASCLHFHVFVCRLYCSLSGCLDDIGGSGSREGVGNRTYFFVALGSDDVSDFIVHEEIVRIDVLLNETADLPCLLRRGYGCICIE